MRRLWGLVFWLPDDAALRAAERVEAAKPKSTSDPAAISKFLKTGQL